MWIYFVTPLFCLLILCCFIFCQPDFSFIVFLQYFLDYSAFSAFSNHLRTHFPMCEGWCAWLLIAASLQLWIETGKLAVWQHWFFLSIDTGYLSIYLAFLWFVSSTMLNFTPKYLWVYFARFRLICTSLYELFLWDFK